MTGIALVLTIAVMVEATVDTIKCFYDYITGREYKKMVTKISALAVSISLCFSADADLCAAVGVHFKYPAVGILMTGIFASRGANYVSDLLGAIIKKTR